MKRLTALGAALLAAALGLAGACGEGETVPPGISGRSPEELVRDMRSAAAELAARTEHDAPEVKLQHILVAFQGSGTGAQRTAVEAELLAAELYARARAGEDFDLLVKNYTDDSHPGIYTLSLGASSAPGVYPRGEMVPAFGATAWRLEVGGLGVAPFDAEASPFGWHVVVRLE